MIRVNQPHIPTEAHRLITSCLKTKWISGQGKYVTQFEQEFAEFLGVKYALTTNSGTTALHLALMSLDIGPGDEVILPALTIASCYFAIWYTGATAVPIDASPDTYNIDPQQIEAHITPRTKAIMIVHLYGLPCQIDTIKKIADKHHLPLIEDASQSHGAKFQDQLTGSLGDIGCFSFYANKIITTGEGGILTTNHPGIIKRALQLKGLNQVSNQRFVHQGTGFRYDMTNMQAALGLASLHQIKNSLQHKQAIAATYRQNLKDIPGIIHPPTPPGRTNVYWMYAIRIITHEFGLSRDQLSQTLMDKFGIETRTFFYPPNIAFAQLKKFPRKTYPVAHKLSLEGLYLPTGLGHSLSQIRAVCHAIQEIHS